LVPGISGGWAAKELTEKGLKTLLLERGRDVKHVTDYTTANLDPWELANRNMLTQEDLKAYPSKVRLYHFGQDDKHFFIKDSEHPYDQVKPFQWIQGNQTGGKSLLWSRHTFDGAILTLKQTPKKASVSTGLFAIKTLLPGMIM
jgi:choline dehydrogenase-like flavoprotein